MEIVNVSLGTRSYPIYIGKDILKDIGRKLKIFSNSNKLAIVTNSTVAPLYLQKVKTSLEESGFYVNVVELPDGEEFKTLHWAEKIFDKLIEFRMDRQCPLLALGGGVIGDITGFAAATYLRGVPFIQIPTTLLAQVDSSVGGKTGVNHEKGKNLIGAFYQPKFVYIDIDTLKTLDVREIRAGLAEVIKYGVIEDEGLFEYIEDNVQSILSLNEENLKHIIKRSCEIKAKVVEDDELESGYRANLNFGHTFGHAVEALTEYKEYKHGEAVAIGMVASGKMSNTLGLCEESVFQRIQNLISKAGLPWKLPAFDNNDYLNAIKIDKKVIGDMLRFVLTDRIGHVDIKEISEEECTSLLEGLKN